MVHLTNLRFDVKFMHFSLQELRNELCDLTIIGDGGAGGCSKSLLCFLAEEKNWWLLSNYVNTFPLSTPYVLNEYDMMSLFCYTSMKILRRT